MPTDKNITISIFYLFQDCISYFTVSSVAARLEHLWKLFSNLSLKDYDSCFYIMQLLVLSLDGKEILGSEGYK